MFGIKRRNAVYTSLKSALLYIHLENVETSKVLLVIWPIRATCIDDQDTSFYQVVVQTTCSFHHGHVCHNTRS